MTQAESKAAVQAGVQQEQLEAEERRRSVVLLLLGLAAVLVFWLGFFGLVPGAAFSASSAFEGVAGGNVVLVGYNGSQKFFVWAPPGSVVRWDVAFCNAVDDDVFVVVKVVEVPKEVRRFLFYINETKFGWDGVNYTEWRTLLKPAYLANWRL